MIVLHIINSIDVGGAEKTLLKLCKLTQNKNLKHYVISLQLDGVLLNEFQNNNIKVIDFNFNKNLSDVFQFLKLYKLLQKIKPDFVMTWLYHSDLIGLLLKFFSIKKFTLIWNIRCSNIDFNKYSIISKIIFKFLVFFSKYPDLITFNSYKGKDFHQNSGYRNINMTILPNFIDTKVWKFSKLDRIEIRKKFKINSNEFLFANIGRNDPQKNQILFIEAAKKIIKIYKNSKFLMIGKNTYNLKIEDDLKKNFIILEYQSNINQIFSAIDYLILTSSYGEGFSNVILESMSMSTLCLASDVGDNSKILSTNDLIFENNNLEDLIYKLNNLINLDQNLKRKIIFNNRKSVLDNYDTAIVLKQFLEIWKK